MKKINKLRLNNLSKTEMENREMNALKGGCACVTSCGCLYAGGQCSSGDSYYGGSSDNNNSGANGTQAHNNMN